MNFDEGVADGELCLIIFNSLNNEQKKCLNNIVENHQSMGRDNVLKIDTSCSDTTQLFNELHLLCDSNEQWYFRGQQDNSSWFLHPSVWRDIPTKNLINFSSNIDKVALEQKIVDLSGRYETCDFKYAVDWLISIAYESNLLYRFYKTAHKAGLYVKPEVIQLLRKYQPFDWTLQNYRIKNGLELPFFGLVEIHSCLYYALGALKNPVTMSSFFTKLDDPLLPNNILLAYAPLPQHHGLPTRFLDWTTNPWKAAYFAADSTTSNANDLAIYAIKIEEPDRKIKRPRWIKMCEHHDRHNNRFLHAQSGCFSTTNIGDAFFLKYGKWPTVEEIHTKFNHNNFFELRKYTLPHKHRAPLVKELKTYDISKATMMPHHKYVAEEVLSEIHGK